MFGINNNPRGRGLGVDPRWVSVTFFLAKRLNEIEMKQNHETQDLDKMAIFSPAINIPILSLRCCFFCFHLAAGVCY